MDGIIHPEIFKSLHIKAFFTGKSIGADKGEISSITGIAKKNIYLPVQKHTDTIITLNKKLTPATGDAVITKRKDLLIGVQTADCVPVLLFDKHQYIISAVHAGWRGTGKGILKKVINRFISDFSSNINDIIIAFGPSISSCCYNVGYEVIEGIKEETGKGEYYCKKDSQWFIDLVKANVKQAVSLGMAEENIWISGECTSCSTDRFYSYRKDKDKSKRQGGFIGIYGK